MQQAGLLPTRHQRRRCRLDPPGLDLPRAYGWYPGGYSGRAGEGTEASGPASELPARNTPIRGSRTIELFFFFFPTETASCSRQKPPVGRSRREISPQPRGPALLGLSLPPPHPTQPRNPAGLPSRAKGKRSPGKDSCIRRPVSAQPVSFPVYKRFGELTESKPRAFRNGTGPRFRTSSEAGRRLRSQKRLVSGASRAGGGSCQSVWGHLRLASVL